MTRRRAALLLPVLSLLALLTNIACTPKKNGAGTEGEPVADAATTTKSAASSVAAHPGCHAAIAGGAPIAGELAPGSVTIAALRGKALVVNTLYKDDKASAERVLLSASGGPDGKPETVVGSPATDLGGCCALTWAVATPFSGELAALSFSATRSSTPSECKGGAVAMKGAGPSKQLKTDDSCRSMSMFAGAAHGEIAVSVRDGADGAVDALVYAGGKPTALHLETILGTIDSLAAAVGTTTAAVAYRVVRGATTELHVVKLSAAGEKIGKVDVLDRAFVGAPALAFEGDTLHVVWPSRATDKAPYVLHWTKWAPGGAPQPSQRLATGFATASAPALAITQSRIVLAWTDGEKPGVVKVGASSRGIMGALELANTVSNPAVDAHDPEVAVDNDAIFIVWQELGVDKREQLRASAIKCLE